jgi:hemolysin activation/secretion protein
LVVTFWGCFRLAACTFAAAGLMTSVAWAQEPTRPQLPAETSPVAAPAAAAPVPPSPPSGNCPFTGQGLRITLSRVTVEGSTVLSAQAIDAAVADLIGHDSDISVVCEARDRVARLFADKGYRLTRVDLPPQRISGGVLVLAATEGYVAKVDTAGLAPMGASASLARQFLEPLAARRPTRWDDIERAVLLARDIPGAQVDMRLHASPDGGPGALELIAAAADISHVDVSAGVQNMGAPEFGEVTGFTRIDANSFTPFGERSSLLLSGTTTGGQKAVEDTESAFLGNSGLRGDFDLAYAHTLAAGAIRALGITGDSYNGKIGLDDPIVRGQALNVQVRSGFEYADERNSLGALEGLAGGTPVLFHDELRIVTLEGDLHWAPDQIPQLSIDASLEYRQGVIGLGSSRLGDADLSRADGDPGAGVVRSAQTIRWTFGGRPSFNSNGGPWIELVAQGQWTDRSLLASEQFQVGNFTVGRGYDPGAASGDRAVGAQVQAGWPLTAVLFGARAPVEPFIFYDAARVENITSYSASIASAGGGVHADLPWALHLDAIAADPLRAPLPSAKTPAARLLISLNRVFLFH